MMILNIPLAWLQLARQRVRFIVALAGIAFIVVLMFVQVGCQDALYSSATQVHQSLKGDLFLLSSQYQSLTSSQSFPRNRLYQALGYDGVESVSPLYLSFAKLKNSLTGQKYSIYIIGFAPGKSVLNLPELEQKLDIIKYPDVVLFDRNSRPEFGPLAAEFEQGNIEQEVEIFAYIAITGYRVRVGGLFSLGPSFGVDGNLIVSDSTFLRIFEAMRRQAGMIDVGLITLKRSADPQKVVANLKANLPKDVKIFTRKSFVAFEKDYWSVRTPIGFVFSLMGTMGFVVGVVVVYQILYSNISNHLVEYATLKAMGFKNNYLLGIVFQQALILAVSGSIPGLAICFILYDFANNATHLPLVMSLDKALIVLIYAILMCCISGFFSMSKLRSADPGDIF